jgi:hypothetical protein
MTKTTPAAAYNVNGKTQVQFLQELLRGNDVGLTAKEAKESYGIKHLGARMRDFRDNGFRVRTEVTGKYGELTYKLSARDVNGSRKVRKSIPQTVYGK